MEPNNNREAADRQPTHQGDRELSPVQQSAWDSLEQSRHYLNSAAGAIEELARTLEAFESRRRKPSQHEFTVSEVDRGGGEREGSSNRQTFFDATRREPYDVQFGAFEGNLPESGEDRSTDRETGSQHRVNSGEPEQESEPFSEQSPEPEPFSEPKPEPEPEPFSEQKLSPAEEQKPASQAKPNRIVRRRSGGLEL